MSIEWLPSEARHQSEQHEQGRKKRRQALTLRLFTNVDVGAQELH